MNYQLGNGTILNVITFIPLTILAINIYNTDIDLVNYLQIKNFRHTPVRQVCTYCTYT